MRTQKITTLLALVLTAFSTLTARANDCSEIVSKLQEKMTAQGNVAAEKMIIKSLERKITIADNSSMAGDMIAVGTIGTLFLVADVAIKEFKTISQLGLFEKGLFTLDAGLVGGGAATLYFSHQNVSAIIDELTQHEVLLIQNKAALDIKVARLQAYLVQNACPTNVISTK